MLLIGIGVVAVVLVAIGLGMRETESEPARVIGSATASDLPQRQGEPWEYDAATGSHWDPNHGHWHKGPPPANRTPAFAPIPAPGSAPNAAPGLVETGSTPEPWEYDAVNDKHWDPNHRHWHDGPPPQQ